MFRRFRHRLFVLLQVGIAASCAVALAIEPTAWPAILVCALGCASSAWICGRVARRYVQATLGRLRRMADDVAHGRPSTSVMIPPGYDTYKLNAAINLLIERLTEASQEERRLQEELRRRERLAFLGELAATVAHEVNNPLDGVQNCARILRRSLDDPVRTGQMLDLIDNGLGRIELLVRRLLTLARQHVVRPADARLDDIVTAAMNGVAAKVSGHGIRIRKERLVQDDRAAVDAPLLEQVFVNLIVNAADSMPDGGELAVCIRSDAGGPQDQDPGERYLCVDIADTGPGIAPDVLPHIFEPFYTTKPGGKGTGLGLAIAARIIDAHRGSIAVNPRPAGGTVFTVRLPTGQPPPPPGAENHAENPAEPLQSAAAERK
jgi:signal transduction histidine kinase